MRNDASAMRRPSRVGLLSLAEGPGEAAVRFVLDDLAEAGAFYERHSGVLEPIEFVRLGPEHLSAGSAAGPVPCDAFVLGFYLEQDAADEGWEQALAASLGALPLGSAVYGVCCCAARGAPSCVAGLGALERLCDEAGLLYRGGMAVASAANLDRLHGRARMGRARRKVSEAADELLLAIRCGAHAGAIAARPGLFWRLHMALSSLR